MDADATIPERAGARESTAAEQVVAALAAAQAARAPGLEEYTYDVAELAVAVGRHTGLDSDELAQLATAAELHDIGKLAIPDTIMEKPGSLTDEELTVARNHPVIGARIVATAPDLEDIAATVRSSHEHYDGSGYPDGLAGDEIPLPSRIILVCDAFCAMTRSRPHSPPVTPREALFELRRCAGAQFDPAIVVAFGRTLAAGGPGPSDAECLTRHRRGARVRLGARAVGSQA